jgi:hypothetical protein
VELWHVLGDRDLRVHRRRHLPVDLDKHWTGGQALFLDLARQHRVKVFEDTTGPGRFTKWSTRSSERATSGLLVQHLGSNQPTRSDNSVGDILLRSKAESICLSLWARNRSHPGPKHDQRHQGAKCDISRIMIAARHGSQGDGDCEGEKGQSHARGQTQQHQRTGG